MKSRAQIEELLEYVERDERLHYAPEAYQINGPLALIQVGLAAEANTLRTVLGLKPFKRGRKFRRRKKQG